MSSNIYIYICVCNQVLNQVPCGGSCKTSIDISSYVLWSSKDVFNRFNWFNYFFFSTCPVPWIHFSRCLYGFIQVGSSLCSSASLPSWRGPTPQRCCYVESAPVKIQICALVKTWYIGYIVNHIVHRIVGIWIPAHALMTVPQKITKLPNFDNDIPWFFYWVTIWLLPTWIHLPTKSRRSNYGPPLSMAAQHPSLVRVPGELFDLLLPLCMKMWRDADQGGWRLEAGQSLHLWYFQIFTLLQSTILGPLKRPQQWFGIPITSSSLEVWRREIVDVPCWKTQPWPSPGSCRTSCKAIAKTVLP